MAANAVDSEKDFHGCEVFTGRTRCHDMRKEILHAGGDENLAAPEGGSS